jgi:hypothetical protein
VAARVPKKLADFDVEVSATQPTSGVRWWMDTSAPDPVLRRKHGPNYYEIPLMRAQGGTWYLVNVRRT